MRGTLILVPVGESSCVRWSWCCIGSAVPVVMAIPEEVLMRILLCVIMAIGTLLAAAGAHAQTYDPRFPVCMQVFMGGFGGGGHYFDCSFTSLPQCRASASGRSAMCVVNPFYAGNEPP